MARYFYNGPFLFPYSTAGLRLITSAMSKSCCEVMSHQIEAQDSDILVVYIDKFDEYGIPIRDVARPVA